MRAERLFRAGSGHSAVMVGAALAAAMGAGLVLRLPGIHVDLWRDEAITVGVARHVTHLPSLLQADGSPPLFYVLLAMWMGVFGSGPTPVHILPLVLGLLTIPAAMWVGRMVSPKWGALTAPLLIAFSPLLVRYSTEVRPYSLAALVGLLTLGAALRLIATEARSWMIGLGVAEAACLYTHNYGIFFVAGISSVLLVVAVVTHRPRLTKVTLGAGATAVVLFLPWLPILLYQRRHTGAPWLAQVTTGEIRRIPSELVGSARAVQIAGLAVITGLAQLIRNRARSPLTRRAMSVILVLTLAVAALIAVTEIRSGESVLTLSMTLLVVPTVIIVEGLIAKWTPRPTHHVGEPGFLSTGVVAGAAIVTIGAALATSLVAEPIWLTRYAIFVAPALLIAIVGVAAWLRTGLTVVLLLAVLLFTQSVTHATNSQAASKTSLPSALRPVLTSTAIDGDLTVVSNLLEEPTVAEVLRQEGVDASFVDIFGPNPRPFLTDWRDNLDRLQHIDRSRMDARLAAIRPGALVLLVVRNNHDPGSTSWEQQLNAHEDDLATRVLGAAPLTALAKTPHPGWDIQLLRRQ